MTELEFMQLLENQARAAELKASRPAAHSSMSPQRNKYGVSPVEARTVDDIVFASKAEAEAYSKLKHLQETGEVTSLELQPAFSFPPGFKYIADFRVTYSDGRVVVIDVKGVETEVFKLKLKCFKYYYPDTVLILWKKQ